MQTSEETRQEFVAKMNEEAVQLMRQRTLPSRIVTQLVEQGLDQATANSLVARLQRKADLNHRVYRGYRSTMWGAGLTGAYFGVQAYSPFTGLFDVTKTGVMIVCIIVFVTALQKSRQMRARTGVQRLGIPG